MVSTQSVNALRQQLFASKPGAAAELGEKAKRRRYKAEKNPRAAMVPFVYACCVGLAVSLVSFWYFFARSHLGLRS